VAIAVSVYLAVDVRYFEESTSLFGGAAGIEDWGFWLLTGPSLALFVVPALGVVAEVLPVVFRRRLPMRGIAYGAIAIVAIGTLTGVMQQRMVVLPGNKGPWTGHNWLTKLGRIAAWGLLNLAAVVGVAVIVVGVAGLLAKSAAGSRKTATKSAATQFVGPGLFALFGVLIAAGGIACAAITGFEDAGLTGTVFEEGATIAVAYGTILAGLGALAYWSPKWSGRRVADGAVVALGLVGAAAALLASVPLMIAGFADQGAASVDLSYGGPASVWNGWVTAGHLAFVAVVLAMAALAMRRADGVGVAITAGDDPWDGQTLEWSTASPTPALNFASIPTVRSPEPLTDRSSVSTDVSPVGSPS
jgi:heme/copper-type cytochrome/quinol oxidase subunit 1